MKRLVFPIAIILGWAAAAYAAPPGALTTLHAIRSLTNAEAGKGLPVAFQATVTYYDKNGVDLFVQEGNEAIYVEDKPNEALAPGDRVLVRGKTRTSFGTDISDSSVTLVHHGLPPKPVKATFQQLIDVKLDCMLVKIRATVRSADTVEYENQPTAYFKLLMDGGPVDAIILGKEPADLKKLLDAQVDITGVVSGMFDNKMQLIGIVIEVSSFANVKVIKPAKITPDSLPITPTGQVLSAYNVKDLTRRVRVRGVIIYYLPGSAVALQNGSRNLWVSIQSSDPLRVGDLADATGFPEAHDGVLDLADGEIQDTHIYQPVLPQLSTWRQLASWSSGNPDGHQSDLVSIEGQIVTSLREASQDEFVLISDGKLFTAIFRHPLGGGPMSPMKLIPPGARVRVTGVCMTAHASSILYGTQEEPFDILLRSFDDIAVLEGPPLLSIRNLILLVGLLLAVVLAAVARGWSLERKMRRQTVVLAAHTRAEAALERRRSHILEQINGAEPLASILEQIAALVSFQLRGAPCWCQIADGARLGEYPPAVLATRLAQQEILARSGASLGRLIAAFNPETPSSEAENEALLAGARLATLAIETRRLNADLLHRSEFDMLTDIHNRFSLEKRLTAQIEEARHNAGIFGLIYIDLDDFKQVNDLYGHRVGDLYLQEVARRMKLQLRAHDLLARLGGDEFAAMLPMVRSRADVEEIAQRLEHCLEDALVLEGHALHGSASFGIALYPEDSTTTDGLLSAADAAMYAAKQSKK